MMSWNLEKMKIIGIVKNVEVEKLKLLFSDDEKFEIKSYLKGDVNWIAKAVSGVGEGYGSDLIFSKNIWNVLFVFCNKQRSFEK